MISGQREKVNFRFDFQSEFCLARKLQFLFRMESELSMGGKRELSMGVISDLWVGVKLNLIHSESDCKGVSWFLQGSN